MKNNIGTVVLVSAGESFDTSMNSMLSIQVGLNFVVAFSLAQILTMFHPLQIMVFISMLKLEYPANATYLSNLVSHIINLDTLDPDVLGQILFDYKLNDAIREDPNFALDESNTGILIP